MHSSRRETLFSHVDFRVFIPCAIFGFRRLPSVNIEKRFFPKADKTIDVTRLLPLHNEKVLNII